MKKTILTLAIATVLLTSCSTPESSMISQADSFIKEAFVPKLKDPSSYESISTEIIDTIQVFNGYTDKTFSLWMAYSDSLRMTYEEINEVLNKQNQTNREWSFETMDVTIEYWKTCQTALPKDSNPHVQIRISHKYKAMNGFGLVSPHEVILCNDNSKFVIYSNH
jgi:hypothetical protein